jgi:hypothetical protein
VKNTPATAQADAQSDAGERMAAFEKRKCCCGHTMRKHREYVGGGHNVKGSRYVCTVDNCNLWAYCDL